MNIASDGGDEPFPAAETGETARTLTIALITKMGKVSAGLQLNGATFRLTFLRCSLELFEGTRAPTGGGQLSSRAYLRQCSR